MSTALMKIKWGGALLLSTNHCKQDIDAGLITLKANKIRI